MDPSEKYRENLNLCSKLEGGEVIQRIQVQIRANLIARIFYYASITFQYNISIGDFHRIMIIKEMLSLFVLISVFFIFSSSAAPSSPHLRGDTDTIVNERDDDSIDISEKKSKLVAFLLSFFLGGLGADWFYLSQGVFSYIMVGIIKMFLIGQAAVFCISFSKIGEHCCNCQLDNFLGPCMWMMYLWFFLWWMMDWFRVLTNDFPDGNGMGLIRDI